MAGQIIVSSIKTDSDNSISFVSNTGATIFSANLASGLSIDSFGDNTITSDKIVSVANTKISGNIVSSQITSVANTQLTGTVTNAQVGSSVYEGMGMRNRIINGDMRIDQRNAGAAVTVTDAYTLDRWEGREDTDGAASFQQVTDAPTGFVNSLKVTTTTADGSLSATQRLAIQQPIEGTNVSDLAWGTANAKTITLSFWVKSSLTGTFGGSLSNGARNRSYPFTYAISSANTWEYKTVTIAGDTTGTWLTNTLQGVRVYFGLGVGTTYSGIAGAWGAGELYSTTGAVSVIGTLNATWQVTGVQFEVGSVATPFERRPYGTELSLCQRYFYMAADGRTQPSGRAPICNGTMFNTTSFYGVMHFPTTMRTSPSLVENEVNDGIRVFRSANSTTCDSTAIQSSQINCAAIEIYNPASSSTEGVGAWAEIETSSTYYIGWSAEL